MIGKEIGNYQIIAEINSGAFGSVYKAEHTHLKERIVAIKLLHTYMNSPQERERFSQEAQILSMLEHPHILPLYDFGFSESQPYLIAKYAAGGSLRDRLKQQKLLPIEESVNIIAQVGQALHHAHQRNIIHRDLKPENILFDTQGNVLLADFGIAIILSTASVKHLTTIGGTPPYMAPEQFQGNISKEGDQYALGCIAYELMTGYLPFTAPDFLSMGFKHLTEQPIQPTRHNPQIPAAVEATILKAMAKQRGERHTDILAFLTALSEPSRPATIVRAIPPLPVQPTVPVFSSPKPVVIPTRRSSIPPSPAPKSAVAPVQRSRIPPSPVPRPAVIPARWLEVSPPPPTKENPLRRLRNFVFESRTQENEYYLLEDNSNNRALDNDERLLYTILDVGTTYARAMIFEVQDDTGIALGVGHHQQSSSHMSGGLIIDIPGVIANCNEALL